MAEDVKSIEEARDLSLQARAEGEGVWGTAGLLLYLASGASLISPWWSRQRDVDLDRFWKGSDHLAGTIALLTDKIATVPVRVVPRDTALKSHFKQAEEFNIRLSEESEFGQSWIVLISKWLTDYFCTDNIAAIEVIGGGKPDGPIVGPALGLANLDSLRCTRTGDIDYPITYLDTNGHVTKFHRTRVAYSSNNPSARAERLGIGFCSLGRCINVAQNLMDMSVFKQEHLGSRPIRGILQAKGIKTDVVVGALEIAQEVMDNQSLQRFAKLPIIGDIAPEAGLELLNLSSLPDGFNEETSTRLGMFTIALAFGVPIRWIWPAATSGATKADAMYQHIAGLGGSIGKILSTITVMLGGDPRGSYHSRGKFLPPHLKLVFDFQDDEQDRMKAEIAEKRAKTRSVNLQSGVYTLRVSREEALEDGDITRAQFEQMELNEGRLPSGEDITTLFYSADERVREFLDLGVVDPMAVEDNDRDEILGKIKERMGVTRDFLSSSGSRIGKQSAKQSLVALSTLYDSYRGFQSAQVEAVESEREEVEEEEKKGLLSKMGELFRKQGPTLVKPRGDPLPPIEEDTVPISDEDIDEAIAQWNERMPAEAKGVLEAREATAEERALSEVELAEVAQLDEATHA